MSRYWSRPHDAGGFQTKREIELVNGEFRGNNARLQLDANCLAIPEPAQTTNAGWDTYPQISDSNNREDLLNKILLGSAAHTQR